MGRFEEKGNKKDGKEEQEKGRPAEERFWRFRAWLAIVQLVMWNAWQWLKSSDN